VEHVVESIVYFKFAILCLSCATREGKG